jgi:GNAT superfamily N-acetyltransferase
MDPLDYNFAHSLALFAATSKTGETQESRDLLLTSSGAPVASFNQGVFKHPDYKLSRTLERVLRFRDRVKVPLCMNLSSQHASVAPELLARGFAAVAPIPGMLLSPVPTLAFDAPGLRVRRVDDAATLEHFAQTAFESFGFPVELAPVALTEDLIALPHAAAFVGYLDGQPACCSLLLMTGTVAGIYWVGTLARFRQHGFGAAITAHAVLAGAQNGCSRAWLQASAMGAPVYARMGFATVREYLRFELPAAASV